ncbi:hypothetical protein B0T19DRAFT_295060 [Cercophora scortea]|uniref:NACHT domain-containing protein n=1 Tax=Cercophora scortea TaxID=314031 RepID=A0AAE0I2Y6_9PEZI|nr:hypothetical protein B0T19DRAFT_295060 [Cercophora scortea]
MAEAIALAASVTAIVQIADRVIGVCKHYIRTARDAPSDLRTILVETSTLKTVFENLEFLNQYQTDVSASVGKLASAGGPIKLCLQAMAELESLLSSSETASAGPSQTRTKGQRVKEIITALAWPLKETRARKLLEDVTRCKETVTIALSGELVRDVKYVKQKVVEVHQILDESQRREMFRWLERTDPSPIHVRNHRLYEPRTGGWVKRSAFWGNWLSGKDRFLWLHGIPGAGKTVLMSHLIEDTKLHCQSLNQQGGKVACVYYYCNFSHAQDESTPFLRWVISQLCRQSSSIPTELYQHFRMGMELSLSELLNILERVVGSFSTVFILIDALDESSTPRDDLLKLMRDFVHDPRFHKIQLIASSREYIDIEKAMKLISTPVPMDNDLVEVDIRAYVRSALASNAKFSGWPRDLLAQVEDAVSKKAQGMFRWAVCQISTIAKLRPNYQVVQHELATLPKTLNDTYERVFLSIDEEERPFVSHLLKWIYFLSTVCFSEVTCANLILAAKLSSKDEGGRLQNYNYDKPEDAIRELCGCLVAFQPEREFIDDALYPFSTVFFAHYTVLEYLVSPRIATGPVAVFTLHRDTVEVEFIKTILKEALSPSRVQVPQHYREIEAVNILHQDINSWCKLMAAQFVSSYHQEQTWRRLMCEADSRELAFKLFNPTRSGYTAFLEVAQLGMVACSNDVIAMQFPDGIPRSNLRPPFYRVRWDPQATDDEYENLATLLNLLLVSPPAPLAVAFMRRHQSRAMFTAEISLQTVIAAPHNHARRSLDNIPEYDLRGSVLEIAGLLGWHDLGPISLIIDHCPDTFDPSAALHVFSGMWSPFDTAYRKRLNKGDWEEERNILSKLLTLKADPDLEGYSLTPLQIATACSDEVKVRILLQHGADPRKTGKANGVTWRQKSFIGRHSRQGNFLSCFHEVKPLDICRQLRSTTAILNTLDVGYDIVDGYYMGELSVDYKGGEIDEDSSREMRKGYRYLNNDGDFHITRLLEANLVIEKLLLEHGALDEAE